jgi:hypothetical protein
LRKEIASTREANLASAREVSAEKMAEALERLRKKPSVPPESDKD